MQVSTDAKLDSMIWLHIVSSLMYTTNIGRFQRTSEKGEIIELVIAWYT